MPHLFVRAVLESAGPDRRRKFKGFRLTVSAKHQGVVKLFLNGLLKHPESIFSKKEFQIQTLFEDSIACTYNFLVKSYFFDYDLLLGVFHVALCDFMAEHQWSLVKHLIDEERDAEWTYQKMQ